MNGNVSVLHLVGKECKKGKIEVNSWSIYRQKLFKTLGFEQKLVG